MGDEALARLPPRAVRPTSRRPVRTCGNTSARTRAWTAASPSIVVLQFDHRDRGQGDDRQPDDRLRPPLSPGRPEGDRVHATSSAATATPAVPRHDGVGRKAQPRGTRLRQAETAEEDAAMETSSACAAWSGRPWTTSPGTRHGNGGGRGAGPARTPGRPSVGGSAETQMTASEAEPPTTRGTVRPRRPKRETIGSEAWRAYRTGLPSRVRGTEPRELVAVPPRAPLRGLRRKPTSSSCSSTTVTARSRR